MANVSKVILEYISENTKDEDLKRFLLEILNFELEYQVLYEENDRRGRHSYSQKYMELIKEMSE